MLDIYTVEQRATAMAIFGMGVMVGPILGPTLGGYLTDVYDWRWVFYVNLPIGIVAVIGLVIFMPSAPVQPDLKFDWTGFGVLAVGIGALQLMLDRGQTEDWFNSPQIMIEAVLVGLGASICSWCTSFHRRARPRSFRRRCSATAISPPRRC